MQLQLGNCLFWSTGLHYRVVSSGVWLGVCLLRARTYCGKALPSFGEASPVLHQIAVFFSRLSASLLAGLSGEAKTAALHDANHLPAHHGLPQRKPLLLAGLHAISQPPVISSHAKLLLVLIQAITGFILPLCSLLFFERTLRYQYVQRLLRARGIATTSGGLQDEKLHSLIIISSLGMALTLGAWQVVELLDALYPSGVSMSVKS